MSRFATASKARRNQTRGPGIARPALLTILFTLSVISSEPVHGKTVFEPADFGGGTASLSSKLRLPADRKQDTYKLAIMCQAIIGPEGKASEPYCFGPEEFGSFSDSVRQAVTDSVFIPARIDGNPVQVLMNFMVMFRCSEKSGCKVFLIPNHGYSISEFGLAYSAPQPILESRDWYAKFPDKLALINAGKSFLEVGGAKFLVSTLVDEAGQSSGGRVDYVEDGESSYESWAEETAGSLAEIRYIPGYYHKQPTPMRHYEYWLDPEGKPYRDDPSSRLATYPFPSRTMRPFISRQVPAITNSSRKN